MPSTRAFDFWYAVHNTQIVLMPRGRLETFGVTLLRYHLLAEPMDSVGQVRIREGRIQSFRPQILTPQSLAESPLESGFASEQAEAFVRWLREHEQDISILKYGFKIRQETVNETVVHDALPNVLDRVKADLEARDDPYSALLVGVDEPWEVCLLTLLFGMARQSAPGNARELRADPDGSRHEIEAAFRLAARDKSSLSALASLLRRRGRFAEYEDRFYALVRAHSH